MNQTEEYRKTVIPDNVPVFGLTAGLPVTLSNLTGPRGKIWGMPSFGFSAPYKVLDEKLGFTPENVYHQVRDYLGQYK
jgi:transketolase